MAMKLMMFLLVSTLMLLISPTVTIPIDHTENLREIVRLSEKLNTTLMQEMFVDNVKARVNSCNTTFFCKVQKALNTIQIFHERGEPKKLFRNLQKFIEQERVNCTKVQSDMGQSRAGTTPSNVQQIQLPRLIEQLTNCVKTRIFNMPKKNNP